MVLIHCLKMGRQGGFKSSEFAFIAKSWHDEKRILHMYYCYTRDENNSSGMRLSASFLKTLFWPEVGISLFHIRTLLHNDGYISSLTHVKMQYLSSQAHHWYRI